MSIWQEIRNLFQVMSHLGRGSYAFESLAEASGPAYFLLFLLGAKINSRECCSLCRSECARGFVDAALVSHAVMMFGVVDDVLLVLSLDPAGIDIFL